MGIKHLIPICVKLNMASVVSQSENPSSKSYTILPRSLLELAIASSFLDIHSHQVILFV